MPLSCRGYPKMCGNVEIVIIPEKSGYFVIEIMYWTVWRTNALPLEKFYISICWIKLWAAQVISYLSCGYIGRKVPIYLAFLSCPSENLILSYFMKFCPNWLFNMKFLVLLSVGWVMFLKKRGVLTTQDTKDKWSLMKKLKIVDKLRLQDCVGYWCDSLEKVCKCPSLK